MELFNELARQVMTVGVAALVELQTHSVPLPSLMTAGLNFL